MMRTGFGGLGLIALFVAVVVGLLATFGAFGKKTPAAFGYSYPGALRGTTVEQTQLTEAEQMADNIGETVTAGDVSWTVSDAHRATELNKVTPPPKPKGGKFVIMTFTVKNVSEGPVTLTGDTIFLLDKQGRKFAPQSSVNSGYIEDDKNILFNEKSLLQPGETRDGQANFEVPDDASGFILQLRDTNPNSNKDRYLNLGF